jgi:hypothetical protein
LHRLPNLPVAAPQLANPFALAEGPLIEEVNQDIASNNANREDQGNRHLPFSKWRLPLVAPTAKSSGTGM